MTLQEQIRIRAELDLALTALGANLPDQAWDHLRHAIHLDPQQPEARLAEARIKLLQHRPQESLGALDAHDQYDPQGRWAPGISLLRATALAIAGKADLAKSLSERLCAQFPDDARLHRLRAAVALAEQQHDVAVNHLRQVVRLEPSDRAAARTLGDLLAATHPQDAVDLLLQDHSDARDPAVRLKAARLLQRADRLRDAKDLYAGLLRERADDGGLWIEAGLLSDQLGEASTAERRLRRAVALGGGLRASRALARVLMHNGQFGPAGRIWWRIARQEPLDAEAWAGLRVCALASGKTRLAQRVDALRPSANKSSGHRQVLARLWQHAASGAAIRVAAGAPETKQPPVRSPLEALVHQARQALAEHVCAHPRRADAHYHLAICENALGDTTEASRQVDHALLINSHYAAASELSSRLKEAA